MSSVPGVLTPNQLEALSRLTGELSPEQLLWASGYLAGFAEARRPPPALPPSENALEIAVLYASQTGNAEKLARRLHGRLRERGYAARVEGVESCKPARLKRDSHLFIVASTHGEGEPPDHAREFHEFLHGRKAPRLEHARYAVLALGDAGYEFFCKTGRDFDARLEELGAARLHPLIECDVDYEDSAAAWIEGVLEALAADAQPSVTGLAAPAPAATASAYSRKNPFAAELLDNIPLTGRGSTKDVRHIELSLADSGLSYQPGDALGVWPTNWPERVGELIALLGLAPDAPVPGGGATPKPLAEALLRDYDITTLTRPFLEKYAELAESAELAALLREENRERLRDFLYGREIIDVVAAWPVAGLTGEAFVSLLRKLPPRLYSIASSPRAHAGEVHLTVGVVRYESHGRRRQGVASAWLADRAPDAGPVPVYVHENPNFRLPADPAAPLVMIGPGTGIAPFRAFVAEREAIGATGRNWLFFGDRHFDTDFLYQREWLDYRKSGVLNRIDVAFSRDSDAKVYVQHRLLERSRELYAWLEEGAHVYVCGDAERMAGDVHEALLTLVAQESGGGRERAEEYLGRLQAAKRYQRDVY